MKNLILKSGLAALLLAVCVSVSAADRNHTRFGVIGGFTSSKPHLEDVNIHSVSQYHVGVALQIPIFFGFSLQPAVLYQNKGFDFDETAVGEIDSRSMNNKTGYIEVPVQIQWGPDLVACKPYLFAEPFVGYGLHTKSNLDHTNVNLSSTDNSSFSNSALARWEYGLGLGVGVDVWKLQLSAKYYWNFGSLYSASKDKDAAFKEIPATIKDTFKGGHNFKGLMFSLAFFF